MIQLPDSLALTFNSITRVGFSRSTIARRYALRECIVQEHPLRRLRKFVPYLEQPERKVMDVPAASGMESDSVSGQFT